ncbi:hypothetical protein KR026_007596, partial [Drosophila bipectinata]
ISGKFEFTNIKCNSVDKSFDDFEYCYLKSVNRSYKYLSLKVNLFKTPITKIKVTGIVYKRFNGYRPFMYNVTVDFCRLMSGANKNPIAIYGFNFIKNYSNINHTCPYDHDLLIEKLDANFMNYQVTKVLPVPEGDYLLEVHWIAYDIERAVVQFFVTIS